MALIPNRHACSAVTGRPNLIPDISEIQSHLFPGNTLPEGPENEVSHGEQEEIICNPLKKRDNRRATWYNCHP